VSGGHSAKNQGGYPNRREVIRQREPQWRNGSDDSPIRF